MLNPALPNHADNQTIKDYLKKRIQIYLRTRAGYQPPKIENADAPTRLPPVTGVMEEWGYGFMDELSEDLNRDFNPRFPYLMMIWMWVGDDNPYRWLQHEKYWEWYHLAVLKQLYILTVCPVESFDDEEFIAHNCFILQFSPSLFISANVRQVALGKIKHNSLIEYMRALTTARADIQDFIHDKIEQWAHVSSDEDILKELSTMSAQFFEMVIQRNA